MKVRAKGSAAAVRQRAATERAARTRRTRLIAGVGAAALAAVVALIVIGGVLRGGNDAIESRLAPTDGFVLGSPDAKVVLTVWEDFQCPVCKAANASTLVTSRPFEPSGRSRTSVSYSRPVRVKVVSQCTTRCAMRAK